MSKIDHIAPDTAAYPPRDGHDIEVFAGEIPFFSHLQGAMAGAKRRIWVAVSFINRAFRMPDGTLWWDLLDALAQAGLEVRVLFWRNPAFFSRANIFQGDPADLDFLRARHTRWTARWDSSGDDIAHCHHQKTWLIDPGEPDGVAFVGGMVKTRLDLSQRASQNRHEARHDVTLSLRGPAVIDVAHNFVQRWNEARHDPASPTPWPDPTDAPQLAWPTNLPEPRGQTRVQVLRTLKAGLYTRHPASPGGHTFPIHEGESSIHAAYSAAFEHARHSIYIENQHPGEERLLHAIEAALARGVKVLYIVPGEPMEAIVRERARALLTPTRYRETFATLQRLATQPNFTLAGIARAAPWLPEGLEEVYVHAKVCSVDGAWSTIGSANLVDLSMTPNHTEINVAYWETSPRSTTFTLLSGHLGQTLEGEDTAEWIDTASQIARDNALRRAKDEPMRGDLYALDPAHYASVHGALALWRGEG